HGAEDEQDDGEVRGDDGRLQVPATEPERVDDVRGEQQHQQGPQEAPYAPLLLVAGEADGGDVAPQPPTSRRRVGGAGPRRPRCRTAKAAPPATAMRTRTSLLLGVTPAQHLPSPPESRGLHHPGAAGRVRQLTPWRAATSSSSRRACRGPPPTSRGAPPWCPRSCCARCRGGSARRASPSAR